ncbi:MAG TPA: DUF3303 family protein [Terracidiphilus sp.]|nr:DUF3303 family protein [Terracidiphilus sp.]
MVIERFPRDHTTLIRERFTSQGRMLPDDVKYLGSWIDPAGLRCFQLMEAPDAESLTPWTRRWNDLVDFEVIPVLSSAEFWAEFQSPRA